MRTSKDGLESAPVVLLSILFLASGLIGSLNSAFVLSDPVVVLVVKTWWRKGKKSTEKGSRDVELGTVPRRTVAEGSTEEDVARTVVIPPTTTVHSVAIEFTEERVEDSDERHSSSISLKAAQGSQLSCVEEEIVFAPLEGTLSSSYLRSYGTGLPERRTQLETLETWFGGM